MKKPFKNKRYCTGCSHQKMLFDTEKEAVRFLEFNAEEIGQQSGKKPVRAYYCERCCGWHITSKPHSHGRFDLINRYGYETGNDIYKNILPLIAKGSSISRGLTLKLKELRHNLKYQCINCNKCQQLINDLFDFFEVVISAHLEDKATIDKLFSKFSTLCEQYTYKNKWQTEL